MRCTGKGGVVAMAVGEEEEEEGGGAEKTASGPDRGEGFIGNSMVLPRIDAVMLVILRRDSESARRETLPKKVARVRLRCQ